jgi:Spy/CpxP family protein refolding chaperone
MKIRQLILATFATAALLVPTAIWAADHPGPGGMGFGMRPGHFGMGGMNVLRLANKLGLSSDQVTQIKGIISAARTANQPIHNQLKANQQAFKASYNPAQFDANAVNAYIAQQTPLMQQLVVSRFQTEANVLGVLTPTQLTQYNQLRAQFEEWRQSNPGRP